MPLPKEIDPMGLSYQPEFTVGKVPDIERRFGDDPIKDYGSLLFGGGAGAGIRLLPRLGAGAMKQMLQSKALRDRAAQAADPVLERMFRR